MKVALCTALAVMLVFKSNVCRADLVYNGGFEFTSNGSGQLGYSTDVAGWSTDGYFFAMAPGLADSGGIDSSYGNVQLWGPALGVSNGLPATSPNGGNYIMTDAAFGFGTLSQVIGGLTPGMQYDVSFWWAGAQQYGYNGVGSEAWHVSLGGVQAATATLTNSEHGFTGWTYTDLLFRADSASETLSFMADGGPAGAPPFALLDGVSVTAVPEPASIMTYTTGLIVLGLTIRRRRRR